VKPHAPAHLAELAGVASRSSRLALAPLPPAPAKLGASTPPPSQAPAAPPRPLRAAGPHSADDAGAPWAGRPPPARRRLTVLRACVRSSSSDPVRRAAPASQRRVPGGAMGEGGVGLAAVQSPRSPAAAAPTVELDLAFKTRTAHLASLATASG
jgi:hypothetical protein